MAQVESVETGLGEGALLERDGALALLERALGNVRGGHGRLVLVSGDAGIGKSALVRRFCVLCASRARLLQGFCDGLGTPRPLGPLVDIGALAGGSLQETIAAGGKAPSVFEALLDELRSDPASIVVLEDAHWADEATLDLLGLLGRRIEQTGALVIATYRSDELPRTHPLRILLGDLTTVAGTERIQLEPLSPAAVAELAAPYGADPADLHAKTAGDPFFVTEVLAGGSEAVPPTIRDAVLARSARLSAAARALLDAVAIVPQRTELWLLEALAEDTLPSLDDCLTSGMLHAEEHAVAFRHELARIAIEESINPHRRIFLHRAALRALRTPPSGGPDLARLAHHAEAADDAAAVIEFAPEAGARAANVGSHREAAAQYARALRHADLLPLQDRAALLERRSFECYLTDQHEEAIAALEEALELYRTAGDLRREGAGLCSLASRRWCASDTVGALEAAENAVELLERLPPGAELARAYATASSFAMNVEQAAPAISRGKLAFALAEEVGDRDTLVYQLNNSGTMALLLGQPEGREQLERSIALAADASLEDDVGRGYIHLGWVASRTRDFGLLERLAEGIDYCATHGLELWRLYLVAYRSRSELDQGRWTDAAESASFVLRQPNQAPLLRVLTLTVLAVVRARRGDPDPWSPLDEAGELVDGKSDLQHLGPVALARAEVAWLAGRPEAVAEATAAALVLAAERKAAWLIGELAFWRWRAGVDDACPPGAAEAFAVHISGDAARAAELWHSQGCPYEAALALADTGDTDALRRALAELRELGAGPAADMVARRLRDRGERAARGPRRSTRMNHANLTSRELEVLALVADGLRNAEIAGRLFLSEKTVDHHVSSILRKLDVRTRARAGAEAVRLGLARQDR